MFEELDADAILKPDRTSGRSTPTGPANQPNPTGRGILYLNRRPAWEETYKRGRARARRPLDLVGW